VPSAGAHFQSFFELHAQLREKWANVIKFAGIKPE